METNVNKAIWKKYNGFVLLRAPHSCHGEQAFVTFKLQKAFLIKQYYSKCILDT